ncbi:MAG: anti-sigma factor [Chloroflexota bacterium]
MCLPFQPADAQADNQERARFVSAQVGTAHNEGEQHQQWCSITQEPDVENGTQVREYGLPAPDHSADFESLAGLHAFGALDGHERARFERHLEGCGRCVEVVDGDLAIVSSLSLTVPEVEAPPGFKERLLARAEAEMAVPEEARRRDPVPLRAAASTSTSLAWLLPVAALIVALLVGAGLLSREISTAQIVQSALLENRATGGQAEVLVRRSGEGVIQLSGFENLQGDRVYQAWVIREGSQPAPAGTSTSGNGTLTLDGDVRGATVAVTVEPRPGAQAPSTQPFLVGSVPS